MTITIGSTVLCAGQQRSSNGTPVGPANLRMGLAPGVMLRDYVGADRTQGEHVKCDHGTLSFGVERIFQTPAAALEYLRDGFLAEESEGELKFDAKTVFPHAAVTGRTSAVVGCAVAVNYTIEG